MKERVANLDSHVKALEKHAVIHEEDVDSLMEQMQALTQQAMSQQEELQQQQEAMRGSRGKRTADAWRLVDLQLRLLAVRSDVCAFVKGKQSKGSGTGTDMCKNCGKKGHWARDCGGPRGGTEHGIQGYDGNRSSKRQRCCQEIDGNFWTCGMYGHTSETCLVTRPTKPTEKGHGCKDEKSKQVDVLDEQEKAGEDADKYFGDVSNALWPLRVMSDNVENDWIEVTRDRRSGRHRQVQFVPIRMSGRLS